MNLDRHLRHTENGNELIGLIVLEAMQRLAAERAPLWKPLPGPQTSAYLSDVHELFWGGSAGSGKSDLLLGLALTQHSHSIIYRREYAQLKGLVLRSNELLRETDAKFNGQSMIWRDIPGQRILEFGACQYEKDVQRYQGRPHDFIGFDELAHFTEQQYRFLTGWLRTTDETQRTRIVSAGNPPTDAEGEWVIRRWGAWLDDGHSNPAEPSEIRWYASVDGEEIEVEAGTPFKHKKETIMPRSRTFIPARLTDNPYLAETDYASVLQGMPEPLRSQLLYGDFSIGKEDDAFQVIPTDWVRQAQARWTPNPPYPPNMTALGVDVARGGADKTVLAPRHGNWYGHLKRFAGTETPDGQSVAALIARELRDNACVLVDVIGVGASPYDIMQENRINVRGINVAEASTERAKGGHFGFANKRSELAWKFRERLDPATGDGLMLPPDRQLLADLTALRWKVNARGIQIESKEDIKKRIGRSTDDGDAVILASDYAAVVRVPKIGGRLGG